MEALLEDIRQTFLDLSIAEWIGQIAGIVAFIVLTVSYQFERRKFLVFSIVAYLFFGIESALTLLSPSVMNNVIAIIRNVIMIYYLDKYNKTMPKKYLVLLLGILWLSIVSMLLITKRYDDWYNYITPLSLTAISICYNFKNYYILKLGAFIMEVGMLVYYAIYRLPFSILRQIILVLSVVISVIIMFIKDIKKKHEKPTEEADTENINLTN